MKPNIYAKKKSLNMDKCAKIAEKMADGDSVLAEIILAAMRYARSEKPHTTEHEGIVFYCMGHNASHEFYVGRKDGETWKYVCGESLELDEQGYPGFEQHVYKCTHPGLGYCGHY